MELLREETPFSDASPEALLLEDVLGVPPMRIGGGNVAFFWLWVSVGYGSGLGSAMAIGVVAHLERGRNDAHYVWTDVVQASVRSQHSLSSHTSIEVHYHFRTSDTYFDGNRSCFHGSDIAFMEICVETENRYRAPHDASMKAVKPFRVSSCKLIRFHGRTRFQQLVVSMEVAFFTCTKAP